jgi:hypothetical protein
MNSTSELDYKMQPKETATVSTASLLCGAAGVAINEGTFNSTAGDLTRVEINVNINSQSNAENRASPGVSDSQQVANGGTCEHCGQSRPLPTSENSVGVGDCQTDAANVLQQASPQFILIPSVTELQHAR